MQKRTRIPFNLQMFASSPEGQSASNDPVETEAIETEEEVETDEKLFREDEVNAIVADRLKREREKSNKKQQQAIEEAVKNALEREKSLSKMTDAEKLDQELKEREQAIADREAEADYKELLSDAKNTLVDRELPSELAELIVVKGDVELTHERIKLVEEIIKARDAERDKARLRQKDPKIGSQVGSETLSEGARAAKERNERKQKPVVSNWG